MSYSCCGPKHPRVRGMNKGQRASPKSGVCVGALPSSFGDARDLGKTPALLLQDPQSRIPAFFRTSAGRTIARRLRSNRITPYTGLPFGPPIPGCNCWLQQGTTENAALDKIAPPASALMATRKGKPSSLAVRGRLWVVLPSLLAIGKCPRHSFAEYASRWPQLGHCWASNWRVTMQIPFRRRTLDSRCDTTHPRILADQTIGPRGFQSLNCSNGSLERCSNAFSSNLTSRLGYVGSRGFDEKSVPLYGLQPAASWRDSGATQVKTCGLAAE